MVQKKEKKVTKEVVTNEPPQNDNTSSLPEVNDNIIKKRTFILKNINFDEIDTKYGLSIISNIENIFETPSTNITKIVDVLTNEPDLSISFYEENSKEYKCLLTMDGKQLQSSENICCFWCKHTFKTLPLGCPVKYVNKMIEKSYISQITKGEYSMRENITSKRINKLNSSDDININEVNSIKGDEYFVTDGFFCSFNCILAFIHDNKSNVLYKESLSLINVLYKYLISKDVTKIIPAPHWRLLKNYGGCLTIEEFRNSFNRIIFDFVFTKQSNDSIKSETNMFPLSFVYKKNKPI